MLSCYGSLAGPGPDAWFWWHRQSMMTRFSRLAARPVLFLVVLFATVPVFAGPLPVTVSVAPQAYVVEAIGGERVTVQVMVDPGQSAHTFSPSPRRLVALSDTRLYVKVGHPEYAYERRFLERLHDGGREVTVVSMVEDVELRELEDHHHDHDHHVHGETDPHVWVSPRVMRRTAERIAEALIALDPEGRDVFEQGLEDLLAEIDALDAEIRDTLSSLERRVFLVNHPAWGYFADDYRLVQLAIESEGKDSGPAQLAALIEEARELGIGVVFVQPGFASRGADVIARELGGRTVKVDPMARDWPATLRIMASALAEAEG